MTFLAREDAGCKLGQYLLDAGVQADLVLGLPRGGVIVGAEVARILRLPLDVMVVRKIGHPRHREFAIGALAEGGVVVLDQKVIEATGVLGREMERIVAEETARLQEHRLKFERNAPAVLEGKRVILVDDGLATGATAEAAVLSAKQRGASEVTVAVPVASDSACDRLNRVADKVIALLVDPTFDAVGRYYELFSQTSDEEVVEALSRRLPSTASDAKEGREEADFEP